MGEHHASTCYRGDRFCWARASTRRRNRTGQTSRSRSWCRPRRAAPPTPPRGCSRCISARCWASSSTSRTAAAPATCWASIPSSRSPADGYTLLLGAGTITINHLVYKKLPYDVLRDLTPVTQMVSVPNVLVVHASQPMKTLADYIAAAKATPGKINYALGRRRQQPAPGDGAAEIPHRHRRDARAVQGRRAGDAGHARRPCHVDGVERRLRQAAHRRRQAPRARASPRSSARRRCPTFRRCRRRA